MPLKHGSREINHIVIQPPRYEHTIRWNRGDIPSGLALLSELCGLPERVLRQAVGSDMERLTMGFAIQGRFAHTDVAEGRRPLATPEELLPELEPQARMVDQVDPRFPHVEGPIKRFPAPPVTNIPGAPASAPQPLPGAPPAAAPEDDNFDMGLSGPEIMKAG